jgi:hypothetical protein
MKIKKHNKKNLFKVKIRIDKLSNQSAGERVEHIEYIYILSKLCMFFLNNSTVHGSREVKHVPFPCDYTMILVHVR